MRSEVQSVLADFMAYQVLARKYRPQRFADVAGQEHVTVTLMNALTQQRIAHGYIFSGHRGIGKTTIARILAMALNCRNVIGSDVRPTPEPCEVCESCTEIRAGNAVDVIEIDAATNRGIDEIRELRDAARYRPARDKYKIYILDEAHQITDAAFNALLKTLEEPPDHIVFMMATTQPEDIPQTVRSRCQHFNFHAVKMVDILNELKGIAAREGVDADEAALSLLAEAGDGSMRDALSVMDQAIASAPTEAGRAVLSAAQIRELMGTVSNAVFERLLEAVDGGRSAEVITLANELMDAGNSPSQLARQCVRYLRNVLMAKIAELTAETAGEDGIATEILQISPDERRRAARTAARFTEEELTRYMQVMLRTFDELGYRQEQRFHFELGLLKLVHLRRLLPMEELLSQLPSSGGVNAGARPTGSSAAMPLASTSRAPVTPSPGRRPSDQLRATGEQSSEATRAGSGQGKPAFSPFAADTPRKRLSGSTETSSGAVAATPEAIYQSPDESASRQRGDVPGGEEMQPFGRDEGHAIAVSDTPRDPPHRVFANAGAVPNKNPKPTASAAWVVTEVPEAPAGEPRPGTLPRSTAGAPRVQEEGSTHTISVSASAGDVSTDVLRQAAIDALLRSGKQTSAGEALEDAEWQIDAGVLRVQTGFSKTMLGMVLNPEADKIARAAIREAGGTALKVEWLPGNLAEKKGDTPRRTSRSGSAQAKAEEHPIVRQAQELFHAEIRKVIDLSGGK